MTLHGGKVVLVIDNAPRHSRIEEILEDPEFEGNVILRLPPYSPMLNPIEPVWSVSKAEIKSQLALNIGDILSGVNQGNLTMTEFRLQALESIIRDGISVITPGLCNSEIAAISRPIPNVLNLDNMEY